MSRGFKYTNTNTNTQNIIWYNTIMLERTMHLAIILLLVKCRFQNHWSDGKRNAKVNRQQVNINVFVRCFAIIVVQENIWILFETLIFELTFIFFVTIFLYLCVINFTPIIRVLATETQSLVMFHALWERKRPFWGDLVLV